MKGLIIQKFWLDQILSPNEWDRKIWEMRSTKTKVRGKIGLIEAKSGLIVGEAYLTECSYEPIPKLTDWIKYHKVRNLSLLDKWKYAWVLENAKRYDKPIPYNHPQGAVIWVNLPD